MQALKTFQRTINKNNNNSNQNPEIKLSDRIKNLPMIEQDNFIAHQDIDLIGMATQNQTTIKYISQIYNKAFYQDDANTIDEIIDEQNLKQMVKCIKQQISRLNQRQLQYIQLFDKLQNSNKKTQNEQKWKIIIWTYKQKITKLQAKLKQERQSKTLLQQTIQLEIEEKQRLTQLNNIKHRKINNLLNDIDNKEEELGQLNNTISKLQSDLSQIKESNSVLSIKMQELVQVNMNISNQLQTQRQRTVYLEQQREEIVSKFKVLGDEQQEINKQIWDLKAKYQTQITKLQNKIANLTIENQQALLLIQELQQNQIKISMQKCCLDKQTQTQAEVVKACYFNSLADQLSDQNQDSFQFQSNNNQVEYRNSNYQHLTYNTNEDFDLRLDLAAKIRNQQIFSDRQAHKYQYAKETMSQRGVFAAHQQTSFDDGQSVTISNTPSKYLQTMGELTSELAEAYQKINDLTARVGELEGQKSKVERKLREHQIQPVDQLREKKGFGYFSSFFKK